MHWEEPWALLQWYSWPPPKNKYIYISHLILRKHQMTWSETCRNVLYTSKILRSQRQRKAKELFHVEVDWRDLWTTYDLWSWMGDSSLKKQKCQKEHYWNNWTKLNMDSGLDNSELLLLNFLILITTLQLF